MSKKAKVSAAHNIYYVNEPSGSMSGGWLGPKPAEQHRFERFSIKAELKKLGYEGF